MAFINTAQAHEVYVLPSEGITHAVEAPSPNPFTAISGQEKLFLLSGAIALVLVLVVLSLSVSRVAEKKFDPWLYRLKKFAPFICRVTLGLTLVACGYFQASYGPELPLAADFGISSTPIVAWALMIMGVLITVGLLTRILAILGVIYYIFLIYKHGSYMLTYVSFLGELLLFVILGGGKWSLDDVIPVFRNIDRAYHGLKSKLEPYSFLILRVLYGLAILTASLYAKFLHSNLALETVSEYHLTNYFHFTPLFLVLGAFIVEAIVGICIAIGFEIRFAVIVFTGFLILSISFFGESVWPHLILFGTNIALFFHGYDRYTVTAAIFERSRRGEPVL